MEILAIFEPINFSIFLFMLLLLFVAYLLLPRGLRVHYFGAYPKRYAWSARARSSSGGGRSGSRAGGVTNQRLPTSGSGGYPIPHPTTASIAGASSVTGSLAASSNPHHRHLSTQGIPVSNTSNATSSGTDSKLHFPPQQQRYTHHLAGNNNDDNNEIIISTTMQQLREPGILIVAHGSRGKPKTVRLQLTETAITWRTETRKKQLGPGKTTLPPKMGKLHQVPLHHIMYVDVGKQTTALRRVENAGVAESLCFSLLTKEGSLDLEASSPRERDALVNCFSLVLDEVHAQNWRDIYRGPSSDMPSSFDEFEENGGAPGAGEQGAPAGN